VDASVIALMSPPIPYFIGCGTEHYRIGDRHINRYHIGHFDLIVVEKGTVYIGEGEKQWELGKDEALILRPDLYHYGFSDCKEEASIHWIHFHTVGVWAEHGSMQEYQQNLDTLKSKHQIYGIPGFLTNPISLPKHSKLSEQKRLLVQDLMEIQNEHRSIAAWKQQNVFQQLLEHMDCEQTLETDMPSQVVAEKAMNFIRNHYHIPITNKLLQDELNYHPNYIAKCMRKLTGLTPLEFAAQYRLEKSKTLLLNTEYPIARIAEEVGLGLSAFSISFKKAVGVSPLNYRKRFVR
jgi:AraC-like DNA-binding protein